jgi:hypothetical protein
LSKYWTGELCGSGMIDIGQTLILYLLTIHSNRKPSNTIRQVYEQDSSVSLLRSHHPDLLLKSMHARSSRNVHCAGHFWIVVSHTPNHPTGGHVVTSNPSARFLVTHLMPAGILIGCTIVSQGIRHKAFSERHTAFCFFCPAPNASLALRSSCLSF